MKVASRNILCSSFAGVEKMLIGKKFPQNLQALRFAVLELLRGNIDDIGTHDELQELSSKSKLSEHWIENLIKPVFFDDALCEGRERRRIHATSLLLPQNDALLFRC